MRGEGPNLTIVCDWCGCVYKGQVNDICPNCFYEGEKQNEI